MSMITRLWLSKGLEEYEEPESTELPPEAEDESVPEETPVLPTEGETEPPIVETALPLEEIEDPVPSLELLTSEESEAQRWARVMTALEDYDALLTEVTQAGGLVTPELIRSVDIGIRALDTRLTATQEKIGLEAFTVDGGEHLAPMVTLENLKENLKKAGQMVWEAIKKLMNLLADMWDDLFNRYERHNRALKDTLAKVERLEGTPKKASFVVGGAENLSVRGKLTFRTKESLDNLRKAVLATSGTAIPEMMEVVNRAGKETNEDLAIQLIRGIARKHYSGLIGDAPFPGEYRFTIKNDPDHPFKTSFDFGPDESLRRHLAGKKVEVDTPSPAEMAEVLRGLIALTALYRDNKTYRRQVQENKKVLDKLERRYKEAAKVGDVTVARQASLELQLARQAFEFGSRPTRDFNRYLNNMIVRYHALIKQAMAQYPQKQADDKGD